FDLPFCKHFLERLEDVVAGLNFIQPAPDETNPPVPELDQMLDRLPGAVPVVGDHVIEITLLGVVVDHQQRPRAIDKVREKMMPGIGPDKEYAVHKLLIVEL